MNDRHITKRRNIQITRKLQDGISINVVMYAFMTVMSKYWFSAKDRIYSKRLFIS